MMDSRGVFSARIARDRAASVEHDVNSNDMEREKFLGSLGSGTTLDDMDFSVLSSSARTIDLATSADQYLNGMKATTTTSEIAATEKAAITQNNLQRKRTFSFSQKSSSSNVQQHQHVTQQHYHTLPGQRHEPPSATEMSFLSGILNADARASVGRRSRSNSISGRLQYATELETKGFIDKSQKARVKDLIIAGDEDLQSALDKYELEGDSSMIEDMIASGALNNTGDGIGELELLNDLDFNFLTVNDDIIDDTTSLIIDDDVTMRGEGSIPSVFSMSSQPMHLSTTPAITMGIPAAVSPPDPVISNVASSMTSPSRETGNNNTSNNLRRIQQQSQRNQHQEPQHISSNTHVGSINNTTTGSGILLSPYEQLQEVMGVTSSTTLSTSRNRMGNASGNDNNYVDGDGIGDLEFNGDFITDNVQSLVLYPATSTDKESKLSASPEPKISEQEKRMRSNSLFSALLSDPREFSGSNDKGNVQYGRWMERTLTNYGEHGEKKVAIAKDVISNDILPNKTGSAVQHDSMDIDDPNISEKERKKIERQLKKEKKERDRIEKKERKMRLKKNQAKNNGEGIKNNKDSTTGKKGQSSKDKKNSGKDNSKSSIQSNKNDRSQDQEEDYHVPGSGKPRSIETDPNIVRTIDNDGLLQVDRPDGWVGAYSPESRKVRIDRFLLKRNHRVWKKTVKYDVRKNFADSRLRVKGRFVKKEDEMIMRDLMSLT